MQNFSVYVQGSYLTSQKTLFWQILPKRLTKLSYEKSDNAKNFINMIILAILRHTAVYPLHPGIKFWPYKCVNSANPSLHWLYYKISCSFRLVQNFHISTHFSHFATLVKCKSGYRPEHLITFLTTFCRCIGKFWEISKALWDSN